MKCETALMEGRGQAFSLHLPLTVLLFMRLTFARWKGPESQRERKTLPTAGLERCWEECCALPCRALPCRAELGWVGLGCSAIQGSPLALPQGDPFTSRQLSGCLPLTLPARCDQPGSLPGKPWPSCPACSTGGLAAPSALVAAAAAAACPQGCVW